MSNQIAIVELSKHFTLILHKDIDQLHNHRLQVQDLACIIANTMASFTSNVINQYAFSDDEKNFLISRVLFIFANQTYESLLRESFMKDFKILKGKLE